MMGLKENDLIGNYFFDLLCAILGGEQDERDFEERKAKA